VLGGTVITHACDSLAILQQQYPDIATEYHPTFEAVRERIIELHPEALIQPEFSKDGFNLPIETVHVQVFHGTSDKVYNKSRKVRDYDLVLLPGERMRETLEQAHLLRPGHYAVVGYPKLDRVFRGELPRDEAVRRLNLDPAKPVVMWAPTWRDYAGNSSIPRFAKALLSTVPSEYNLVVKLHPNTKRHDRRYWPVIEQLAAARPNVTLLATEHDPIPTMAAADVLLTDISTVSHEFLCFDRPLVFLDPRLVPLGWSKTWVWRCGDVVRGPGRLWPAVAQALAHPEAHAAERKWAREQIFFQPDGHAAERAAEAIRKYLEKSRCGR
jgi:CDP-glycerol glycerophosphotransferase (TagB/SpsB family)